MKIWKRVAALIALAALLVVPARAEIDLSGLSLAELVELRQRVTMAMWETGEWQEVTVPIGLWVIGEDIPAGHWTIRPTAGYYSLIMLDTSPDQTGRHVAQTYKGRFFREYVYSNSYKNYDAARHLTEIDLDLQVGDYIEIDDAAAVFTPFTGKPDLGFK